MAKQKKEKTRKFSDLVDHEKNPRTITEKQFKKLNDSLKKRGDLSGIVFNARNGKVVGGHMRNKIFKHFNPEIIESFRNDKPDQQGTVCEGYIKIVVKGTEYRYTYREVDWDEKTHEQAMIEANKLGGDWDWDILANEWYEYDLEDYGFDDYELGKKKEEDTKETTGMPEKKDKECPECGHKF